MATRFAMSKARAGREMTAVVEKGNWHGWHGFRRGLATRLNEAQVQVEVIQEILRHSDPKVTQDGYIVIKSNATTKAMQKVDASGLGKRAADERNTTAE